MFNCSGLASPVFDDAGHMTVHVADDAPITRGLVEIDGEQGERAADRRDHQPAQARRPDQRHVAVQYQHGMVVGDDAHGLHDGVARAQLLGLEDPLDVVVGERLLHLGAAVTVDHVDMGRIQGPGGPDDVAQQRLPGQRLQHFRQIGVHPFALTRSENDHGECHDGIVVAQRLLRSNPMAFSCATVRGRVPPAPRRYRPCRHVAGPPPRRAAWRPGPPPRPSLGPVPRCRPAR